VSKRTGLLSFSLLLAVIFSPGCSDPASKLPNYGAVPVFTMTDSEGHSFDSRALSGKVWIADFIYTKCPAECPLMTARMHKLQQQVKSDKDLQFVSISVDPQHDTPPVLNEFAHRFGGPADDWTFLTGSAGTVHVLAYQTFHVGDVISKMDHSTKFVLVDKRGNIRGYYSSFENDALAALLKDAAALQRERL
jgi:protein SCO1/2